MWVEVVRSPRRAGRKRKRAVANSGSGGGVAGARPPPAACPRSVPHPSISSCVRPSVRPERADAAARWNWSGPHHGLGSRRELHPPPTHPPTARARAPCDHRGLPRPPAGPPGLHPAVAPAARAAGEPRSCPRSPLWLVAARRGLVCCSHQDARREEVQQRPVRRSDRFGLLLPAVPLGTSHGGVLGLSREAPCDAAVPGRSGHLVCRVGGLQELRSLPGLQGDRGRQQGQRQPLHSHRCRPGLAFRPQPRHGSHRSGLLAGLHAGPHAWRLPACGEGALARSALCGLRPAVYFLLPAGDAAPGEAGTLHRPGVPSRHRPAQPRGPAPFLGCGPWPGPTCWRWAQSPSPPGPGVLPLPLPVLGPGVHPELPCSPALPVHQPAPGKDVFLHRPHHGHRAGHVRPKDQPRRGDRSGEAGHPAAGARLPPHRLGAHAARAGPGAAALLLRCCHRGALPVLRGRRLWLARAEGHDHGHAAEPGRPGPGGGTHGGCLSVLAGRGQGLFHHVLRPIPAPLPAPAEPEASSPHGPQGRVAEPAPPPTSWGAGMRPGRGPLPSPWGPALAPARHPGPSVVGAWAVPPVTLGAGLQHLPGFLFALL